MNTCAQRTPPRQPPPKPMHTPIRLPRQHLHTPRQPPPPDTANALRHCHSNTHTQPATRQQHIQRQHTSKKASPDRSDAKTKHSQLQVQLSADPCLTPRQGRASASPDRSDAKTKHSQLQVQLSADPCLTPRQGRATRTNPTALERPEKTHSNATLTYRCGQKRHTTTVK